jgi:membrane protein implicated in regulation of membrane protease activity
MSGLEQLFQDYHTAIWVAVGLLLLMIEIMLIPGFFLSYAVAALLMALLFSLFDHGLSWLTEVALFLVVGTVLLWPARIWFNRRHQATPDINHY